MKRILALIVALLMGVAAFSACTPKSRTTGDLPTPTPTPSESPSSEEPSKEPEIPYADQDLKQSYGVYNIETLDGKKVSVDNTNKFVLDYKKAENARFTFHIKERIEDGMKYRYYAIYLGDNETRIVKISNVLPKKAKLVVENDGYNAKDKGLWTVENYEDGSCRLVPMMSHSEMPICLAVLEDGTVGLAERDENAKNQLFKITKAGAHPEYEEFASDKGEVFVRIPYSFTEKRDGVGLTDEFMKDWTNWMQEAVDAEVELTGFRPYDIFVISGWEELGYVAGVSDNYNFINANVGFMRSEMYNVAQRAKKLNIMDMSFGMLHELGHMFDSQRGWNFESEAWTDLKLCYVIWKLTEDHKATDGLVFGCASADYSAGTCFTYETMAEGLDIHAHKGAMETVYGFFAAARLFLLMAYDFGWDPFIKTFHWYQDNGYTQSSFERWERFTTFVDKLSEFSGKDIKKDYLSENNWKVFEDFYTGKTNQAV